MPLFVLLLLLTYIFLFFQDVSMVPDNASGYTVDCGSLTPWISEEDSCYINGTAAACPEVVKDQTEATKLCKPFYTDAGVTNTTYKCEGGNGLWEPYYSGCQPECGIQAKNDKYPWVTAIYNPGDEYICSGTIISPYHVLTAAQCFGSTNIENYTVIANKPNKNIDVLEELSQRRKIKTLVVHNNYKDPFGPYDIAIINVHEAFVLSPEVHPACVDWNYRYEDIQEDNKAVIVGWKSVKGNREILEEFTAPYEHRNTCLKYFTPQIRKYFSTDKFCVAYNNSTTYKNYAGAGIYIKSDGTKYFLRGIASPSPRNKDENSDYGVFTTISCYIRWIKQKMSRSRFDYQFKELYLANKMDNQCQIISNSGCFLPEHVRYGSFNLFSGNPYTPNNLVSISTVIYLQCDDSNIPRSAFTCLKDEWTPSIQDAKCKKPGACPALETSSSEEVFCKLNENPVSCDEPEENVTAVVRCQPFYTFKENRPIFKCRNGTWNQLFVPCNPDCGLKIVETETLIVGGTEALKNEYPWVVAIYNSMGQQICGGTIISRYFVLSAAHCFTSTQGESMNKAVYTIIGGKYYRDINIDEEYAQKRKIKSLHIHHDYRGSFHKFRDDIALVEVDEPFVLTMKVQPVCMDWETAYEDLDFSVGSKGVVTGWGNTNEAGSPSEVLKKLIVPFKSKRECLKNLPPDFSYQYATSDKICGGYNNNGTNVCNGDSGGGLYFRTDNVRFYIRGIVSISVRSNVGCDSNRYALYTKVSNYISWIERITGRVL